MILPVTFPPDGGIEFIGYQGLASHGGVLGLFIGIYFYSRKTKHKMIDTLDLIAVVVGVSLGFIRLANFMNSEIIGMPTKRPWGIIFERVDNVPRHPAQLYEAISYFIIFGIIMIIYLKLKDRLKNGILFGLASVLFFIARFLIEFLKEDQVGFEEGMTFNMGQLLSLPYIAAGIGFIIYGLLKSEKTIGLKS
jgi:prolipoprotein diacylglyceryl transferase